MNEAEFFKSKKFKEGLQQTVIKDTWGKGLPMVYMNENGQIVKHYSDGKIEIVKDAPSFVCKKTKFATEKDALFSLKKIKDTSDRKKIPIRAYKCRCGSWHLTSRVDFRETEKQVLELKSEIEKLKLELEFARSENIKLQKRNNKEENIAVKSNSRVKEQQKQIKKLQETLARVRNDYSTILGKYHSLLPKTNG